MEYDPEFPLPTPRENEAVADYMNKEQQFMAMEGFYENPRNIQIRRNAIHTIADVSENRHHIPLQLKRYNLHLFVLRENWQENLSRLYHYHFSFKYNVSLHYDPFITSVIFDFVGD